MIKRVFAIVLLAVLASVVFGLCTVFGVTSDHAAVVSRAMQDKAEMVAPVNLPPSSDRQCSASVVVSVTVVNPDWHE